MTDPEPMLPERVSHWRIAGEPRLVTAENIFDYMNGAGELYVGYRFDRLEVSEYRSEGRPAILVEIYFMGGPDDAFGLLSLDWGGEPIEPSSADAWPAALYGEGLLRLRSGPIYARIMAERETPDARAAVLELGKAVGAGRTAADPSPPPQLLSELPATPAPDWIQRRERTSFFRTHLLLNSLYYLGPENMLQLDHDVQGAAAVYERAPSSPEPKPRRIQYLMIRYPDPTRALRALRRFHEVYLPDAPPPGAPEASQPFENLFPIEDGWLGTRLRGGDLVLAFECPDRETARIFIRNR